ncbi:hypothetical protein [Dyella flagellata]|uniref:hypothetical protein n=1 Tax=Dyella flagellata TaxID=1867833 RepID=UPI00384027F9
MNYGTGLIDREDTGIGDGYKNAQWKKAMKHLLTALFLMLSVPVCHAVEWGYVFVPVSTANAQVVIHQAFAHGLRPEGQPSGRDGIDFWNFFSRPHTNPLFIMAYRDWHAVQQSSDTLPTGVLFEVALDDNFFEAEAVLDRFVAVTWSPVGSNLDVRAVVSNALGRWVNQGYPVSGITGFQGGHIVPTSINAAWTVDRGQLQGAPQNNQAYQAPTTQMRDDASRLFDPSLAYERLDPQVETVHSSWWRHALAVLQCQVFETRPLPLSQRAAYQDSCLHPTVMTAKQFNRETMRNLQPSITLLLD